jgi:hypothetical protein
MRCMYVCHNELDENTDWHWLCLIRALLYHAILPMLHSKKVVGKNTKLRRSGPFPSPVA